MKYIYLLIILMMDCSCWTQSKSIDQNSFTYFTRQSKFNLDYWKKNKENWIEFKNDTVIMTKFFKDSPCDIPIPETMKMMIEKDTLIFNCGRTYDPNCDRTIGVAGILIDFVINKREYPNYKMLAFKYNFDDPNLHK